VIADLETLDEIMDNDRGRESIRENIETSAREESRLLPAKTE
jgi:hypothetical protein